MRPVPKDFALLSLQNSLDNAIMEQLHLVGGKSGKAPQIKQLYQAMPSPLDRLLLQMDVMSAYGSWYFILAPLLLFMFLMQELAKDKELHLRHGLNVVGVGHAVYWVHWLIVATVLNFV